jgi:6-phosphogluconolactonase
MKKWVRAVQVLLAATAALGLTNCGKYNCNSDDGFSFSGSTCTTGSPSSISSSGSGSSGSSSASAFVFAIDSDASSGTSNGAIAGYSIDGSSATSGPISGFTAPSVPANDGGVGMVIAQKQFLYAGFGTAEQIYGWTIDSSSGALTAISGSPYAASFLNAFGGQAAQDVMITNPAGNLIFIALPLRDEIYAYSIGSGGALTPVAGTPFAVPFGPINLAIDGTGKYLYAVDGNFATHTGTEIEAYSIGSSGALTPVTGSPFVYPMWQLAGEPTGKFLIGTSGNSAASGYSGVDDDNLYVFSISSTGAIAPVSGSPFKTVYSPFSIAVSQNSGGNLIYSFSFNDSATAFNAVEGYQISSTGTLSADAGSPFTGLGVDAGGSWGQFDQSGSLLMSYAVYVNDTNETVTQISPLSVAGGALTQTLSALDLTTPGFWAVTDTQ